MRLEAFIADFKLVDWWKLNTIPDNNPDKMFELFQKEMGLLTNKHFPIEELKSREGDALFYNNKLRKEKRKVRKRYRKGATDNFKRAKKQYERNVAEAKKKFYNRKFDLLKENPRRWYKEVTSLMSNSGKRQV